MPESWTCEACGEPAQPRSGREAVAFASVAGGVEFRHPPYQVCECARCGAWQKTARLDDEALALYYDKLEFETFESARPMPPDRLVVAAARALPEGRRILDYGCGVGRTLSQAVDRHRCFGVEPNARAAAVAASRGISIVADAELEGRLAGTLDMIVAADVYEHLVRPVATLRRLAALLGPGGSLVLLTGCADAVRPRELLPEFWYFRIAGHLRMVSRRHLEWLARESGLELESARLMSHYDPAPLRDLAQRFRLWAYAVTHLAPSSAAAAIVARAPVVRRAARWSNAPMLSCGADHVLATFRKPGEAVR